MLSIAADHLSEATAWNKARTILAFRCLKLGQSLTFDSHYRFPDTNDLSLQHGKNDRPAFEKVMGMTAPVSITDDFSKSRVVQAYNFFVESLDTSKLNYTTIV